MDQYLLTREDLYDLALDLVQESITEYSNLGSYDFDFDRILERLKEYRVVNPSCKTDEV